MIVLSAILAAVCLGLLVALLVNLKRLTAMTTRKGFWENSHQELLREKDGLVGVFISQERVDVVLRVLAHKLNDEMSLDVRREEGEKFVRFFSRVDRLANSIEKLRREFEDAQGLAGNEGFDVRPTYVNYLSPPKEEEVRAGPPAACAPAS